MPWRDDNAWATGTDLNLHRGRQYPPFDKYPHAHSRHWPMVAQILRRQPVVLVMLCLNAPGLLQYGTYSIVVNHIGWALNPCPWLPHGCSTSQPPPHLPVCRRIARKSIPNTRQNHTRNRPLPDKPGTPHQPSTPRSAFPLKAPSGCNPCPVAPGERP